MSILVLTSDTLIGTPATGNIEYNGQFFGTDSNASRAQLQRIVRATAVASTSGTSIDFTGLPAWVKRVTVMFSGVSTSGSNNILIQLGAGSVDSASYNSASARTGPAAISTTGFTTGFGINSTNAANVIGGAVLIANLTSNTWVANGVLADQAQANTYTIGGNKSLSGTLDRIRITTSGGTDTFDAGSINILYEG